MQSKLLIWVGMFVGSAVGGYIPKLWGSGFLSISSLIFSSIGAIVGIWVGFKITQNYF